MLQHHFMSRAPASQHGPIVVGRVATPISGGSFTRKPSPNSIPAGTPVGVIVTPQYMQHPHGQSNHLHKTKSAPVLHRSSTPGHTRQNSDPAFNMVRHPSAPTMRTRSSSHAMATNIPSGPPHVGERAGKKPISQKRAKCCTGLQTGTVLGRDQQYQITQPLGAGCFAEVFKAQSVNNSTMEEVAIKVCPENEAGCRQLLQAEWSNLKTLDHPNIVRFHGVFRHQAEGRNSHPFTCIVMEFCPFGTLKQHIQSHTKVLSTAGVITMAKELASAVGYMHNQGVIHGDLKSDNILITTGGATKIGDFGRSRRMGSMDHVPMGGGEVTYLPPEHGTSSSVAPSFDMWGVGLILAEVSIMELIRSFVVLGQPLSSQKRSREILRQKVQAVHGGQMSPIIMGLLVPEPETRMTATEVYEKVSKMKSNKLVSSLKNLFG